RAGWTRGQRGPRALPRLPAPPPPRVTGPPSSVRSAPAATVITGPFVVLRSVVPRASIVSVVLIIRPPPPVMVKSIGPGISLTIDSAGVTSAIARGSAHGLVRSPQAPAVKPFTLA